MGKKAVNPRPKKPLATSGVKIPRVKRPTGGKNRYKGVSK